MKNKIETFFKEREREGVSGVIESPLIYIVDRKKEQQGDVEILDKVDKTIKGVLINNEPQLKVYYYIFKDNSFRIERYNEKGKFLTFSAGSQYQQCECILFPNETDNPEHWILLIELKYAKNYAAASRENGAYPQKMIEQIIQTTQYLRRHNIIPAKKTVFAIVSFPNVIENFNSTLFEGNIFIENESKIDVRKPHTNNRMNRTQIATKYNIVIQARNEATIKSAKRLQFA